MTKPQPPATVEEAEQRFYAWYSRRFRGTQWMNVLKSHQSMGIPEPAHPTTIDEWAAVALALHTAVLRREEREGIRPPRSEE